MPKDFKIVFVHGYTASSKVNWYPNISTELTKLGIDFEVPDMPGGEHPHASEWLDTMHSVISKIDKPLVLVGHSLGTRAILLYLEKYQPQVKAVFLVATFSNRLENGTKYDGSAYSDFFTHLVDIEKIKSLVGKFVVVHSKDDELPFDGAVEISNQLGAKLIPFEDRDHMSDPSNAPIILKILREELDF
ncbi:MAG TPA: alpha/beta fold hydrolase [Patescibacteria group bacterium]|nr:alpha/beta fold hydrolase [Patescibacteria group bacterium]